MVSFLDDVGEGDEQEFIIRVAQYGALWSATVDGYTMEGIGYSALASIENLLSRVKRIHDSNGDVDPGEFTEEDVDLAAWMTLSSEGEIGDA
jgi:hypothetical protein